MAPARQALQDAHLAPSDIHEVILVGGMTRMPAVQEAVRKIFGREPHKGVNPDEVVAVGAAIQAGVLGGEVKDVLLLDVTPLTLSIETLGGVATALIERNTTIPTRKSQIFSTASDSQREVEIHVVQGERPFAADNKSLGKFNLDGIPPAPRGIPQIEVTFDIDADGILKVSATDKATGRSQHITITASSGLSEGEVEQMRRAAETHADEDRKRRELVEARNTADNAIYSAERALREAGDKVAGPTRTNVEAKIQAVRQKLDTEDVAALRQATNDLLQAMQGIGAAMYEGGPSVGGGTGSDAGGGSTGGTGPTPNKPDDVVDGEFKEA
jgi:molecular chaperone DnaK